MVTGAFGEPSDLGSPDGVVMVGVSVGPEVVLVGGVVVGRLTKVLPPLAPARERPMMPAAKARATSETATRLPYPSFNLSVVPFGPEGLTSTSLQDSTEKLQAAL